MIIGMKGSTNLVDTNLGVQIIINANVSQPMIHGQMSAVTVKLVWLRSSNYCRKAPVLREGSGSQICHCGSLSRGHQLSSVYGIFVTTNQ